MCVCVGVLRAHPSTHVRECECVCQKLSPFARRCLRHGLTTTYLISRRSTATTSTITTTGARRGPPTTPHHQVDSLAKRNQQLEAEAETHKSRLLAQVGSASDAAMQISVCGVRSGGGRAGLACGLLLFRRVHNV